MRGPGQTVAAWERELDAGARAGGRASVALSAHHRAGHRFRDGACARRFRAARRRDSPARCSRRPRRGSTAAGLPAYEISNHARPGAECRHNLVYWRYGDYVGIGPGAHGRLTLDGEKYATRQRRAPEAWLAAVEAAGHATEERQPLARAERREEMLMMGLRLAEGIARAAVPPRDRERFRSGAAGRSDRRIA